MITHEDFHHLKELWDNGRKLDVAVKLKEWEKEEKTKVASLIYNMWVKRTFPQSSDHSQAFAFQSEVYQLFLDNGFKVEARPIIDLVAIKGETKFAVECKNSSDRSKIYEGIGQLLYYKWMTKDQESCLVLAIPQSPKRSTEIFEFAESLGVSFLVLEKGQKEIMLSCKLATPWSMSLEEAKEYVAKVKNIAVNVKPICSSCFFCLNDKICLPIAVCEDCLVNLVMLTI